jgi:hypothetical protein
MTPTACDKLFEKRMASLKSEQMNLFKALSECVWVTARKLSTALKLFADPGLVRFTSEVSASIADRDHIKLGSALNDFLREVDLARLDFAKKTPETILFAAIISLKDAHDSWTGSSPEDYDRSYRCTVMARASLEKLLR